MMSQEFDRNPENRWRDELFASPQAIQAFFEIPSQVESREILSNLPNRDWGRFLLQQLGVSEPQEEAIGGSFMVRTYPLQEWGGFLIETENQLTDQTSYVVARSATTAMQKSNAA